MRGIAAATSALLLTTLGFGTPAAAAGAGNGPTLSAFAFARANVDVTSGPGGNTMNWTVSDKAKGVTNIWGDITIRQQGTEPGTYVGPTYEVKFGTVWDGTIQVLASSGDATLSSYTYTWPIPRYTGTAVATWVVAQVSIRDDQGNTRVSGTPKHGSFTANDLVDSTAPTYDLLTIGGPSFPPPDAVYVGDGPKPVDVEFFVNEEESGLEGGSFVFSGPGGASITTPFRIFIQDGLPTCGSDEGSDTDVLCDIDVTFPADAVTGTWAVTEIDLTDNVGNTGHYAVDPSPAIVHVTRNADFQASNFALSPSVADNWTAAVPLSLSMDITGATGGISTVNLQTTCAQMSTTPTDLGGGAISVPLLIVNMARLCEVTAIELIDGAGNVSVYGALYSAAPLDLVVNQLPDTTPPVATSAHLNQTTFVQGSGVRVVVYADVQSHVGVVGMSAFSYNADGSPANAGSFGGVDQTTDGEVSMVVDIQFLAPGTYTAGFFLQDAGNLESVYNTPNQPVPPWGPLQFTVVAP